MLAQFALPTLLKFVLRAVEVAECESILQRLWIISRIIVAFSASSPLMLVHDDAELRSNGQCVRAAHRLGETAVDGVCLGSLQQCLAAAPLRCTPCFVRQLVHVMPEPVQTGVARLRRVHERQQIAQMRRCGVSTQQLRVAA